MRSGLIVGLCTVAAGMLLGALLFGDRFVPAAPQATLPAPTLKPTGVTTSGRETLPPPVAPPVSEATVSASPTVVPVSPTAWQPATHDDNQASTGGQPAEQLPFFGTSMQRIDQEHGLIQAQEAHVGVVRHGKVEWTTVEPARTEPPTYNWRALKDLEQDLLNAAQAGIEVTLLFMSTPDWAQAVPGHSCGPIAQDQLEAFAQFVQATVERYSAPPYNVRYWEFFNEPDVDPKLVSPDSGFGCWGDEDDALYGGWRYAEMLKHAYPAVKRAAPQAQVILGGLLLDAPDTPPSDFLAGVLESGGGEFFDILAFHAYTYYHPQVYNWDTITGTKWIDWGGVVPGKTAFLRQTMESYGYDKPLILNESGLAWAFPEKPSDDYRLGQADYVTKLFARGRALGLMHVSWYGWRGPGWRHMALLNQDLSPTPAYHAFAYAAQQLDGVEYVAQTDYPGIEGYTFRRGEALLQILWSKDGTERDLSIPAPRFLRAFDLTGEAATYYQSPDSIIMTVRRPVYIELAP